MNIKSMIRRNLENLPTRRHGENEVFALQRDVNRLFNEFFGDFDLEPFRGAEARMATFTPRVNVSETEHEVKVTAELPGLDEKDVEVTLDENAVTIKGEKKEEHEEKTEHSYHLERSYGTFQRTIPLPAHVLGDQAKAGFKKGVLTVTLPKAAPAKVSGKQIRIKAE
jgi:HSP20 family protein